MKTCSVFGLIGLICICLTAPAAATNGKVLVVRSYHADYDWCAGIGSAIAETLSAADIEYKTFYMDTKRKSTNDWKVESGQLADQELKAYQADVVITVDDNAQEFFAKAHAGDPNVSVVFCGVNADIEKYDFPAANVTGIL
jgi:basic membrane lipoprotein Med (substrate-binding protein (PBP1-ABC) superfamily)